MREKQLLKYPKEKALHWLGFVLLLLFPSVAFAQTDNSAQLTATEQLAVLNAALAAGVATGATSMAEAVALRQEFLLIELHTPREDESLGKAGDVYIYDYTTDTLNYATVELATGQVKDLQSVQGVQLALTQSEVDRATQIAIGNTVILEELQTAYAQITGNPFITLEQLKIEAEIFTAVSAPNIVNMQSAECGIHRCALLTLQSSEEVALGIGAIVDLSTQLVVQNIDSPDSIVAQTGDLGFSDTGTIIDESATPQLPITSSAPSQSGPVAASESDDLGIVSTGTIIDESAVINDAGSIVPAAAVDSGAPSQQNDLGVVNTGLILDEPLEDESPTGTATGAVTVDGLNGPTGPAGPTAAAADAAKLAVQPSDTEQSDPNDLGVVSTGMIIDEAVAEGNMVSAPPGSAKASVFIPFMARRLFKNQPIGLSDPTVHMQQRYTFSQSAFLTWWCAVVEPSLLAAEVEQRCSP